MSDRHSDLVREQQQAYARHDTDDLVALWQQRHNGVVLAEGLEAIRRLLLERLGYLPPDTADRPAVPSAPVRGAAAGPARTGWAPFDTPGRWLQIASAAGIFAWVYLVTGLMTALGQLLRAYIGDSGLMQIAAGLTALQAAFFFLVLQVLAEGVRVALNRARRGAPASTS